MLSEIAKVFSSNGVLVPSTRWVTVPGDDGEVAPVDSGSESFQSHFDQAAAKLNLSPEAIRSVEESQKGNAAQSRADGRALTPEQEKQVEKLKERDREVRAHEQQHAAAAGRWARGGPKYEYEAGPDGRSYAVGGSVDIDAGPVAGNPEATLAKAQQVRRAALAPADPSGADRSVAAAATQMALEAQKQLASEAQTRASAARGGDGKEARAARAYAGDAGRAATGRVFDAVG